jgi:hypothetical protein
VPDLVKGLRDVNEGCGTVLFGINRVDDYTNEAMNLFKCGMLRSEAELMGG